MLDWGPRADMSLAGQILQDWVAQGSKLPAELIGPYNDWREQSSRIDSWLASGQLLLIRPQLPLSSQVDTSSVLRKKSNQRHFFQWLPVSLCPQLDSFSEGPLQVSNFPLLIGPAGSVATTVKLLVARADGGIQASLVLQLIQRLAGSEGAIHWLEYSAVQVGGSLLPSSPDSAVVPLLSARAGGELEIPVLSLEQALKQLPTADVVLLVTAGDSAAVELAASILSLQTGNYAYSPYWFFWADKLLIFLIMVFLLWIFPRLSPGSALLSSVLVLLAMLTGQLAALLLQRYWLPMADASLYLVLGALMFFWAARERQLQRLYGQCHNANLQLAEHYYRQGSLDQASACLESCRPTEELLSLNYDIATQLERKRQYDEAIKSYRLLLCRGTYKDAAKRLQQLLVLQDKTALSSTELAVTQTLVVADKGVEKPLLGRYEIDRELGRGAMGVVYLGRDPKIARSVAIKTLNYAQFAPEQMADLKQRFFREAEAAGRLSHPNIVTVYDVGEESDLAFIAMDYVEGQSLSHFVSRDSLLAIKQVYKLVAEVADALDYAHRQNIVHRDIKPSNTMFNAEQQKLKVADFGIARIVDDSRTKTGDILGSPLYMSPEQLKGDKVSGATDIYSLGVTFYQLLTAAVPYTGDSIANLAYQILNKKYKSVREIRPELPASAVRIVNKAMQKNPAKRYADGQAMADAIRKSLARDFK